MKINESELENFIRVARNIFGHDTNSPFSLDDVNKISSKLGLNGVIYLEKSDEKRHVNVLLDLNKDSITLYDPLCGVKSKSFDEIQMGMYCQPLGLFKEEFEKYEKRLKSETNGNIWSVYKQRGKLLYDFLSHNKKFKSIYPKQISSISDLILQKNFPDCVPISLFVISSCNSSYPKM